MIKLDFIIEDLSLYGFIMKFGRKPVFIRVNADKACLALSFILHIRCDKFPGCEKFPLGSTNDARASS